MEYYNANLSATGSKISIPLINLALTAQNTSTTSLRAYHSTAVDNRNLQCWLISVVSVYMTPQSKHKLIIMLAISSSLTLDDLVYTMSQEMHWMRIRSQDPNTKLLVNV